MPFDTVNTSYLKNIFVLHLERRYVDFLSVMYLGLIKGKSVHIILRTLMLKYIINSIMIQNLCESVNKEANTRTSKK